MSVKVFCHGIAKGGDCKVQNYEDYMCWLDSVNKSTSIGCLVVKVALKMFEATTTCSRAFRDSEDTRTHAYWVLVSVWIGV